MTDHDSRDPEVIARDIKQTQHEMAQTVDSIGAQLTPRSIFNAILDKANENDLDARALLEGARRNPLALGLIAVGSIWLVSDSDSKLPAFKGGKSSSDHNSGNHRDHGVHRDYVNHMARVERAADEDDETYSRRRDHARAKFFMMEREQDEDDSAFMKRLNAATERMRGTTEDVYERVGLVGDDVRKAGGDAMSKTKSLYQENTLIAGMAAAFAGAIVGALAPATKTENEQLGAIGSKAIDEMMAKARGVTERATEATEGLVADAAAAMQAPGRGSETAPNSHQT